MDETRTATETEQRRIRLAAFGVMLAALIVTAVLVALQAWTVAAVAAAIAGVGWWWAARMSADLSAQEMQRQAMNNAQKRFTAGPPPADRFEG